MKFRLTLGCALMGAVAFAAASSADAVITGGNVCGLMNVPSNARETLIAVPWVTVGGGDATMKVANLVKTDTLSAGDELYFYDGSTYYRWVLTNGTWTPTATTKKVNGQNLTLTAPGADYAIARGKGLWLVRQDASKEIWLYGQHDASAVSVTITAGTASAPAYTLIANPNTAAYDLNAKGVTGTVGDMIVFGGSEGQTLYTYKATGWTRKVETQKTVGSKTMTVKKDSTDGCTIPAGQGAWYVSVGGSPTIVW